jgi:hypothetical protein
MAEVARRAEQIVPEGRVNSELPPWIQRVDGYYDQQCLFVDMLHVPESLYPLVGDVLPIDPHDPGYCRNVEMRLADYPNQMRKLALLPFPLYMDGLLPLLRCSEPFPPALKRTEPLDGAQAATRGFLEPSTICAFDLYRHYANAILWIEGHTARRIDSSFSERIDRALKICHSRTSHCIEMLMKAAREVPGVQQVLLQMRAPGSHITSFYSKEIARAFEPLAFRYTVQVLRTMQQFIMEACLIDVRECERQRLFVSQYEPPLEHLSKRLCGAIPVHVDQFAQDGASQDPPLYDLEHIRAHESRDKTGRVNPSLIFQTLVQILVDDPCVKAAPPVAAQA